MLLGEVFREEGKVVIRYEVIYSMEWRTLVPVFAETR